ncbi:hypothetical protein SPOG_02068 [Schizosaccharomyces cryophilus OY26]|uniref:Uncharacterized protein n=1 Tax=Schizosaccharomyces cryophilus (strain OY26 / ATCC MYA-4695 / CBS 11777 / NBRC 106824 / NRRL Y48691) TaxID=653667 RepID=S9VYK2_SCHCR|nr:uncharacterized protein SPOG_02068 [Schizosaccharomyces cryophilus OY26]EPY52748.1 hypothetical protein SPOG_02068 [Schizosaccharomyces cryophilus OY26]
MVLSPDYSYVLNQSLLESSKEKLHDDAGFTDSQNKYLFLRAKKETLEKKVKYQAAYAKVLEAIGNERNKSDDFKTPLADFEASKKLLEDMEGKWRVAEVSRLSKLVGTLMQGTLHIEKESKKFSISKDVLTTLYTSLREVQSQLERLDLLEDPSTSSDMSIYSILADLQRISKSLAKQPSDMKSVELHQPPPRVSDSSLNKETLANVLLDWQRLSAEQNTYLREISNAGNIPPDCLLQLRQYFFRSELLSEKLSNIYSSVNDGADDNLL